MGEQLAFFPGVRDMGSVRGKSAMDRYARLRSLGLCGACGRGHSDTSLCDTCKARYRASVNARRHARGAQGLCRYCGAKPLPGRNKCERCAGYDGARRAKRKEAGLCQICGGEIDTDGMRCQACRAAHMRQRAARIDKGVCADCGVRTAGKPLCWQCMDKKNMAAARSYAKTREKKVTCLYRRQQGLCAGCEKSFPLDKNGAPWGYEIDHIVPRSRNGSDDMNNLQLLCSGCNSTKRDRSMAFLRRRLRERVGGPDLWGEKNSTGASKNKRD